MHIFEPNKLIMFVVYVQIFSIYKSNKISSSVSTWRSNKQIERKNYFYIYNMNDDDDDDYG